jgi:hypothetical protein
MWLRNRGTRVFSRRYQSVLHKLELHFLWDNVPQKTIHLTFKMYHTKSVYIIFRWERIKWKPTPPCKLWKLQSEPHDVDPMERSWEMGGVICKSAFANHSPTSHEFCISSLPPSISLRHHHLLPPSMLKKEV